MSESAATMSASFCCTFIMSLNEMSWAPSVIPLTMPLSCGGKNPLGMMM